MNGNCSGRRWLGRELTALRVRHCGRRSLSFFARGVGLMPQDLWRIEKGLRPLRPVMAKRVADRLPGAAAVLAEYERRVRLVRGVAGAEEVPCVEALCDLQEAGARAYRVRVGRNRVYVYTAGAAGAGS